MFVACFCGWKTYVNDSAFVSTFILGKRSKHRRAHRLTVSKHPWIWCPALPLSSRDPSPESFILSRPQFFICKVGQLGRWAWGSGGKRWLERVDWTMLGIDPSCSLILYIYGSFYCTWIANSRLDFHGELVLGISGERVGAYFCDCHSWSSVVVIIHQMQQENSWVLCARFCAECFSFCRFSHGLFVTESGGHNIIFY